MATSSGIHAKTRPPKTQVFLLQLSWSHSDDKIFLFFALLVLQCRWVCLKLRNTQTCLGSYARYL